MIEVEKKFNLSKEQERYFFNHTEFVSKKEVFDTYFDDKDFNLTKNDMWLRCRDGNYELKVCQNRDVNRSADQYAEISNEAEIRQVLKIQSNSKFDQDLENAGMYPFVSLKTVRAKYKSGRFLIDIDEVTAENFFYCLAEIELMAEDKKQVESAVSDILNFAKECNLDTTKFTRGKVIEWIRQKDPKHFDILLKAKVVK